MTTSRENCPLAHFDTIIEIGEIRLRGNTDCPNCLARLADKHAAIAEILHRRQAALTASKRCRVYNDAACIDPSYCDIRGACCAGDPNCRVITAVHALCHECAEMVESIDGKLEPHHGTSGDGCPLNNDHAQIYLHPRIVDRIADLEASLVFGKTR